MCLRDRVRPTAWRRALTVVAALALIAACSERSPLVNEQLVIGVDVRAAPHTAHVPIVTVETSRRTAVTVTATSGDHTVVTPPSKVGTNHAVPVLGLRTDREYTLKVTARAENGVVDQFDSLSRYTTPPLPADFPPIEVTSDAARVSPGITFMNLKRVPTNEERAAALEDPGAPTLETGRIIGVDESGEVVWYYETKMQVLAVEPTTRGTLLMGLDDRDIDNLDSVMREIDLLGNTVTEWSTRIAERSAQNLDSESMISIALDSFHHDIHELPNGHFLTLSTELIEVDETTARRLCADNPATHLVADVVVEFDRDTGEAVGEWPVAAGYDPVTRPGTGMCGAGVVHSPTPGEWMYPEVGGERDWTHANAVWLDEANNTLVVSLRNLSAVVGLRYRADDSGPAGEHLWEFGTGGNLAMQGDGRFPYEQHAVELRDDGTMILYDNGHPEGIGGQPPASRAVIYRVDPDTGTAEQVWEHHDENSWGGPTFSQLMGDADQLDNGDVLITHGIVLDPKQGIHARVVEVAPDIDGGGAGDEVVFDLLTGSNAGEGWAVYAAMKLPSLYPTS